MAKRLRAAFAAAALALASGLAGVLTAQALGQVELPTVSVPTLSLPLPTTTQAPAPPPVPPAPPPPPLLTVTVPTPPAPPPTPRLPTPPPAPPAPSLPGSPASSSPSGSWGSGVSSSPSSAGSQSAGYVGAASDGPRQPGSRSRSTRVTGIRARRVRQGRKPAVRITFTLNQRGRVLFVLRGPAPFCRVAGRFSVIGDRGVNYIRFTGRIGRRELPFGTYRITARTRSQAAGMPVLVAVGERRGTNGFACTAGATTDPFNAILATYGSGATGTASETSASSGVAGVRKTRKRGGVLPAVGRGLWKVPEALPELVVLSPGSPSRILGFGALFLLLTSGLALVLYIRSLWRCSR